jgi:hypothetical protein
MHKIWHFKIKINNVLKCLNITFYDMGYACLPMMADNKGKTDFLKRTYEEITFMMDIHV